MGTFMDSAALHELLLEMGAGRAFDARQRLAQERSRFRWPIAAARPASVAGRTGIAR